MPTSIEELCSALRVAYPSRDKLEQSSEPLTASTSHKDT